MQTRKLTIGALLLSTAAPALAQDITRVATVPVGAEITGMHVIEQGDLFFNIQHPSTAIPGPYNKATVGVIAGADFNAIPSKFRGIDAPMSTYGKQTVNTALGEYQVIAQQGDFADMIEGGLGAITAVDGTVMMSSNDPDFNGFVPTGDDEGYLFTNWENRPGGMSRIKLNFADGRWTANGEDAMMLDFSGVGGTWVNCFGSMAPWGNPLTSEELYFDETAEWINPDYKYISNATDMETYLGHYGNPYDYGYIVEIKDPAGAATPVKQFAMGRYSHENSVVMPDQKTAYLSDDGTGVVFFKFIADTAGDLSVGTLYAAKMTQLDSGNAADSATTGFDIEWIELAHGDNATIGGWIDEYDGKTQADYVEGQNPYITQEEIEAWAKGEAADDRAAFLESRKAAAAKGATAEFRKMEGVVINQAGAADGSIPFVYMAMSSIGKTMADGEGDVRLEANKCGVVYQMRLDENYNVSKMVPVVAGHGYDKANQPNACPVDSISNPDNLAVLNDGRVLIGEDTGNHENNALWIWSPQNAM